jgi:hypothetical protein
VEDAVQAIVSGKNLKTVLAQQGTPSLTLDMSIAEAQLSSDAATATAATEASFEVLELVKNRGMKKVTNTHFTIVHYRYSTHDECSCCHCVTGVYDDNCEWCAVQQRLTTYLYH